MYRVKKVPFKMHLIYRGGLLHAMDVNRYYATHLKSLPCNILKVTI